MAHSAVPQAGTGREGGAAPADATPPAKSTFEARPATVASFDRSGDLQLLIGADGPDQALFTVCSRALSRASPVFNTMLNGPWAEKRPDVGNWVLKLPEDSPKAFRIVLNILHCHFRNVPEFITLEDLYRVCICVDKYSITEPLQPWAKSWCLYAQSQSKGTTKDNALTAWIAWVLGNHILLEKSVTGLLWKSGRLLPRSEVRFGDKTKVYPREVGEEHFVHLDSTGILDHITTIRVETAKSLMTFVQNFWHKFVFKQPTITLCKYLSDRNYGNKPPSDREKKVCDAAVVGSLTTALHRAYLVPDPISIIHESFILQDLKTKVESIPGQIISHDATRPNYGFGGGEYSHGGCNPGPEFLLGVSSILNNLPAALTDAHHKHLKERAGKIGVSYII
ncbi:hypothetical protein RB600_008926 [Gaeumannomyces tritici]